MTLTQVSRDADYRIDSRLQRGKTYLRAETSPGARYRVT